MSTDTIPDALSGQETWLRRLAHSLAHDGDEGDEIFNTTLVAAWRSRGAAASRPGWLAGVARNQAARRRRAATRQRRREHRAARPERVPSAAETAAETELRHRIGQAVRDLGEPYSTTLTRRYWEGMAPAAIARSMDVPVETVRTRIKRGLDRLRRRLDRDYGSRTGWVVPIGALFGEPPRGVAGSGVAGTGVAWLAGGALAVAAAFAGVVLLPEAGGIATDARDAALPAAVRRAAPEPERSAAALQVTVQPEPRAAIPAPAAHTPHRPGPAVETAAALGALELMREIVAAQAGLVSARVLDGDRDGTGEHGYFLDLFGVPRPGATLMARTLGHTSEIAGGAAAFGDYLFRIYLPGPAGEPLGEAEEGGVGVPAPDPQRAEQLWCCYAWPATPRGPEATSPGPVFFVDQEGIVLTASNQGGRYLGPTGAPRPDAAFRAGSTGHLGAPKPSATHPARDGQTWIAAGNREVATSMRVVDPDGTPLPDIALHVVADRVGTWSPSEFAARVEQANVLRSLGITHLPLGRSGKSDAAGRLTLRGPGTTDAALVLRVNPRSELTVPTRLRLDGATLLLEIPRLDPKAQRLVANELATIATLKNISSAQAQCQASSAIDVDRNGRGEYGYFAELSGGLPLRGMDGRRMSPPALSGAFANLDARRCPGVVQRSGYLFAMFLPDHGRFGLAEAPSGGSGSAAPDPKLSATLWCCYAWPMEVGATGKRAFFVNQSGDVLACDNGQGYSGRWHGPRWEAAFAPSDEGLGMHRGVAANTQGNDGERWIVVN